MNYLTLLQRQATSILLLDKTLCVCFINESAEALFNLSMNRAMGLPLADFVHDDGQLGAACGKVMQGQGEIRLRDHNMLLPLEQTEKQVDCIINLLEGDDPTLLIELIEDEKLSRIARENDFSLRQQANQAMIRGLAHEIRNPLGGIRGAAQLMHGEAGSEAFSEYTQIIIQEVDRLANLVDRMQAKTQVDLDDAINIHTVLEHVRQLVVAEVGAEFIIEQDYDPSLPAVRGSFDLLVQAILNLLRNAAEAVQIKGEQGRVRITTRIDAAVFEGAKQQLIRVEIADNGAGVDNDLAARIFDPMVTSKPNGTGLGLPITAEIIAQHGGTVDYFQKNAETVFQLFIPLFVA